MNQICPLSSVLFNRAIVSALASVMVGCPNIRLNPAVHDLDLKFADGVALSDSPAIERPPLDRTNLCATKVSLENKTVKTKAFFDLSTSGCHTPLQQLFANQRCTIIQIACVDSAPKWLIKGWSYNEDLQGTWSAFGAMAFAAGAQWNRPSNEDPDFCTAFRPLVTLIRNLAIASREYQEERTVRSLVSAEITQYKLRRKNF